MEQWQKLLTGDMPPTYEYKIITPSGETKWISQRNVLVTDDSGRPVAIEGFATDITEQMAEKVARGSEKVAKYLDNQAVKNIVFVPGRLINFVV